MSNQVEQQVTILILVHLSACFLIFCLLIWQFLRFCFGKIIAWPERLLAASVAAYFFPDVVYQAFIYPLVHLEHNLEYLFYAYDAKDDASANISMKTITYTKVLQAYPIAGLLQAIGVAVLVFWLCRRIQTLKFSSPTPPLKSSSNMVRTKIYNAIICLTLLLSMYLVWSVCISIPYLSEMKKASGPTQAVVDSTLNASVKSDTVEMPQVPPPAFKTDAASNFLETDQKTKGKLATLPEELKKRIQARINNLQVQVQAALTERNEATKRIKDYHTAFLHAIKRVREDLSTTYKTNSSNIAIDKNALYIQLKDAYSSYLADNSRYYNEALDDLGRVDMSNSNRLTSLIQDIKAETIAYAKIGTTVPDVQTAVNSWLSPFTNYLFISFNDRLNIVNTFYEKDGSDWGFLGGSAGYLIKTKSLDLVLLVGMIGFGILGASILSFAHINNFFVTFSTKPVIQNFPNVLARGFGAALIIYLATKGGLAVFSMGATQDPNGYMLLLTCFAGAVFSEKIWTKISTILLTSAPAAGPGIPVNPARSVDAQSVPVKSKALVPRELPGV